MPDRGKRRIGYDGERTKNLGSVCEKTQMVDEEKLDEREESNEKKGVG